MSLTLISISPASNPSAIVDGEAGPQAVAVTFAQISSVDDEPAAASSYGHLPAAVNIQPE